MFCWAPICFSRSIRPELDSSTGLSPRPAASVFSLAWSPVSAATSALANCWACASSCFRLRRERHVDNCCANVLYRSAEATAVCESS